jgi:hypothetical protein
MEFRPVLLRGSKKVPWSGIQVREGKRHGFCVRRRKFHQRVEMQCLSEPCRRETLLLGARCSVAAGRVRWRRKAQAAIDV